MLALRFTWSKKLTLVALALIALAGPARAQYGYILTGSGAVNRSMAGAAVGAPLDATGALYWNPATISALPNSMDIGVELLWPQTRISSTFPASAFGPGIPPVGLSGSDRGDNGIFPMPAMGLTFRPEGSDITFGLGIYAIGGFGTNYRSSTTNPILTPQPPLGFGLGSIYSELQLIQMSPNVSVQLTDKLSVAAGPTLTLGSLRADPLFVASPNANGQYPFGTHSRVAWGGGFQVGAFYRLDDAWSFGASFKSPQWLEDFQFQTTDNLGRPRQVGFNFDVPLIASVGVGFTGIERWTFATDFRYIDYRSANGTRQTGFNADGSVAGLGWRSIFAVAFGAQYQVTDALSVRFGYSYNDNPIPDDVSSFNVASLTVIQHNISVGATYRVTDALALSMAYQHGFENAIQGPLVTPFGAVPGSTVRNSASVDSFVLGATVTFGPR